MISYIRFKTSPEQNGPTILAKSFHRIFNFPGPGRIDPVDSGQPISETVNFGAIRHSRSKRLGDQTDKYRAARSIVLFSSSSWSLLIEGAEMSSKVS